MTSLRSSPSARLLLLATTAAILVLLTSALLASRHAGGGYIGDDPVYLGYGSEIVDGSVPYRDFKVVYPPGALPPFIAAAYNLGFPGSTKHPRWAHPPNADAKRFSHSFAYLMVACLAVALSFTSLSLRRLRASAARLATSMSLLAFAPLLIGTLFFTRFDAWPALLTAAVLAALLNDRFILAGLALGIAVAIKLYPLLFLPLALAYAWKRRGRFPAFTALAVTLSTVATIFLPFLIVAPHGLLWSLRAQLGRGLQAESVPSSILAGIHVFTSVLDHHGLLPFFRPFPSLYFQTGPLGSAETHGRAAEIISNLSLAATIIVLAALWVSFVRGPATADRLVRYSAAILIAPLAAGRVLSPQFLIWLLPVVPLVKGRRGLAATGLLAASLLLTHLWFPGVWRQYIYGGLTPGPTAILLGRNALVVGILVTLTLPRRTAGVCRGRLSIPSARWPNLLRSGAHPAENN